MTLRIGAVLTSLAVGGALLVPATAASSMPAVAERAGAKAPQPGTYRGTIVDEEGPNKTEFVEFKVSKNGKKVQGFRTRIGMYCYVGPPVYNQIIPTVIEAPTMRIRNGKVDRGWVEDYQVDGVTEQIVGRLRINFKRGRPTTGKIAVSFASCGTTTADPPDDYVEFKVSRKK